MDSVSNGVYRCDNGVWSSRPFCTSKIFSLIRKIWTFFCENISESSRCSLQTLINFVSNPTVTNGLDLASQYIAVNGNEENQVLPGSYVLFYCLNGYQNIDRNLNVTCNSNGQWSAFPNCISLPTTTPSGTV